MKRSGYYYDVTSPNGSSSLVLYHQETFDGVVGDICDIVKRAREQGWNTSERWVILTVEWERVWDDDGMFLSFSETQKAVALWDNGTVIDL